MIDSPSAHTTISSPPASHRALLLLTFLSVAAFTLTTVLSVDTISVDSEAGIAAATTMECAISAIRKDFVARGGRFDDSIDPNHTGLIGEEYTELTSTVGSLEAKRTTTNPHSAPMLVQLLKEAGVAAGDTIAVGCSGSFPALMIATLSAAKTLGVHPIVILSVGASSYGATKIDQTLVDIYVLVRNQTDLKFPAAAASLGGAKDVGLDFEPGVRTKLLDKIRGAGIPLLNEPDLSRNVDQRLRIYFGESSKRRIAAFVNIGGSYADLGTSPLILDLQPGVNGQMRIPVDERTHGVVFAMAKRHIPVVHLLHIKGLALKYGLPWDPIPLPSISGSGSAQHHTAVSSSELAVSGAYFFSVILIFVYYRRAFFRKYF